MPQRFWRPLQRWPTDDETTPKRWPPDQNRSKSMPHPPQASFPHHFLITSSSLLVTRSHAKSSFVGAFVIKNASLWDAKIRTICGTEHEKLIDLSSSFFPTGTGDFHVSFPTMPNAQEGVPKETATLSPTRHRSEADCTILHM